MRGVSGQASEGASMICSVGAEPCGAHGARVAVCAVQRGPYTGPWRAQARHVLPSAEAGLTWNSGRAVLLERRSVTFCQTQHTCAVRGHSAKLATGNVGTGQSQRKATNMRSSPRTRLAGRLAGRVASPGRQARVPTGTHLLNIVGLDENMTGQILDATWGRRGRGRESASRRRIVCVSVCVKSMRASIHAHE